MKSSQNYSFAKVPAPQIQRSVFDRSTAHKTTFDAGYLIPFIVDEILPGDTVNLRASIFARLATLIYPIMDNVKIDVQYFFTPCRLVWDNWEKFNGAQADPDDSTDFEIPIINPSEWEIGEGQIYDYMGLPINASMAATQINALPFRCYNLIYNEWYRDQNLQNSVSVDTDDGPDNPVLYSLLKRGKRHDYFTSCLPWPQKGDSVMLPLGSTAPVYGNGTTIGLTDGSQNFGFRAVAGVDESKWYTESYGTAVGTAAGATPPTLGLTVGLTTNPANSGMIADLSAATAATINQLRQAFAFQKILERDARGGTRYVELLKAHFGVTSPDFRLQRPEYLGGSSHSISVREVAQTAASPSTPTDRDVQAGLSAYATAQSQSGFSKSFVEHGYIIGMVSVRSDMTYQQNIRRMWSRRTRFDFYLPALAHLGEQAVLNQELVFLPAATGNDAPEAVFGYQERWAEYRHFPNMVTGKFRSEATAPLDAWHLAFDYTTPVPLGAAFIQEDPPIDRVIAVPGTGEAPQPQVLFDSLIQIKHARPMPVFSVPGQIDRF